MSYELTDLARDLRALLELPLTTKAEQDTWTRQALRVKADIRSNPAVSDQVPHALWHFFSDADIRREEPEYARDQNLHAQEILMQLEELLPRASAPRDEMGHD